MTELLRRVRRRLRLAWGVATATWAGPAAVGALLAVVAAGRLRPWGWPEPAALVLAVAGGAALVAVAAFRPIPLSIAARAADRGLDTRDAFATALEVRTGRLAANLFAERIEHRAAVLASGRTAGEAVPVPWNPRRVALTAAVALAALGLALAPNPQDEVRRQRAEERARAQAEADRVRQAAAELRTEHPERESAAAAERLDDLARQLDRSPDLAAARQAVDRAAADLAGSLSPSFLAQKAAVRGLDRTLADRPLTAGATGSAARQLEAAASALSGLSPEERAALAERLEELAAAQAAANPEAAGALQEAAGALARGDVAVAGAALGEAAGAQAVAAGAVSAQEATASALGALATSQSRLAAAGQGQGQGSGQGQGQGSGQGQGQGSGQGQGQGQGSGQGQGQGGGTGGASGQVGGSNARGGTGGRGGQGTAAGSGDNPSGGLGTATVYNPFTSTDGEQLQAGGRRGEGPSQTVGRADGPTGTGSTRVPVRDVLPQYRAEASRALDHLDIPPSARGLVRAYFDSLAEDG
ncbi:MAG TPA: hypothetical protein VFO65_06235 [Acidimicrobiales bacterium]|nr:hypothetical protein [Acidimicrobiales bacterium]